MHNGIKQKEEDIRLAETCLDDCDHRTDFSEDETVNYGRRAVREPIVKSIFKSCANRISSGDDLVMAIDINGLSPVCDVRD
jgi:hypothetical protein